MKKFLSLYSLLLTLSLVGCSQDEIHQFELADNHFTATISDAAATRTSLGDGGKVLWLVDDDISLMLKTGYHNRYVVSGAVNSSSTDFTHDSSTSEIALGNTLPQHYAIYPYDEAYTLSDANTINLDVSNWANQTYVEATFEDDKAIMTAKSDNTNLSFRNAFSLLCIQLNSAVSGSYSISSISVSSAAYALNGPAVIDMTADAPQLVCNGTLDANKTNTLNLTTPIILTQSPLDFYLLIPANTYSADDLTISVKGTNEMENVPLDWFVTMPSDIVCERSKKTTLTKTFAAVDFSGSTEGGGVSQ